MATQKENWDRLLGEFAEENQSLTECVKSLLKILDIKEESDSGREFNPVYISSCRVFESAKLEYLLPKLRELVKD